MSEPDNDNEQLLDDWLDRLDNREADHSSCVRFVCATGFICALFGFIVGHIR